MSVMFMEAIENPTRLTLCPKCGKQVRIDEDCDCERLFLAHYMKVANRDLHHARIRV